MNKFKTIVFTAFSLPFVFVAIQGNTLIQSQQISFAVYPPAIPEEKRIDTTLKTEVTEDEIPPLGVDAFKDQFPIVVGDEKSIGQNLILGEIDDTTLRFRKHLVELPLFAGDHYYGKHLNAAAAAAEMNTIPILAPGDRVNVIQDGYLTMHRSKGYIQPPYEGFLYASGVCWSTSALGTLMDEANKEFVHEYGLPLFTFGPYDRSPHGHTYLTYQHSNRGFGYSVVKRVNGTATDYSFTINPELADNPKFEALRLKIVLSASTNHETGYLGHSVEAHIKTNINF